MRAMNGITGNRVASRRFSLPPIGARVLAVARSAFVKRGFQEAHVLAHWPEIVGQGLAEFSAPEKLVFPRGSGDDGGKGRRSGATLTIRVDGPVAVEIRHLEPQIIERINSYYGYGAVARLKLIQGPLPQKPRPRFRRIRPLRPEERAALVQGLEKIEEPALKEALERLGERVIGADRRR
ncbi:MAG: DUF721 domain-containing protein [Alphaproteobacteria bacterium HGW-Alphaproteobacteria-3]|nr:MAG: DUF721 domain-containing protein [Alphaproteobacteria bacterium HGW-Alphaproteobacteria-3]